jgi:ubiquitin-activating enzyme E1 C
VHSHFCKIQSKDDDFYRQFKLVVLGLDSIEARRWINMKLNQLVIGTGDDIDPDTIIPIVDGGTEGFKGHVRVVLPRITACLECSLEMYPPQVRYPVCTIANTPRIPEHCIEYASLIAWSRDKPFVDAGTGEPVKIDMDQPEHVKWLFETAEKRAAQFNIKGVTYRLTMGVIKNIIPAIASTNAIIAGVFLAAIPLSN